MPLIYPGKSRCALCSNVLEREQEIVCAAGRHIEDESDPLYPASREAMHKDCFLKWELRGEYIKRLNEFLMDFVRKDGAYWQYDEDGTLVRHQLDT